MTDLLEKNVIDWIQQFKTYPHSVQISSWIIMLNKAKTAYVKYFSELDRYKRNHPDPKTGGISAGYAAIAMDRLTENLSIIFKNCSGYASNGNYYLYKTDFMIDSEMINILLNEFKKLENL